MAKIKKLPDRPFKVKFKIFRFGFTDFDIFVRRFATHADWKIASADEFAHTYAFANGWNTALHVDGDISLYSPVLSRDHAKEVYRIIDVLIQMDVRLGENAEVHAHYETIQDPKSWFSYLQKISFEFCCASAMVLFLTTKAIEIIFQNTLSWPEVVLFELLAFGFAMGFTFFLFQGHLRGGEDLADEFLAISKLKAHEEFMTDADVDRHGFSGGEKQKGSGGRSASDVKAYDLVQEILFPLENIMAYTRFYKNNTKHDSQHWKDLLEIMEQAIRIREVMNRVETAIADQAAESGQLARRRDKKLFRNIHRSTNLIPLAVKGTDILGEEFSTPSYTLNVSSNGACLLLPDQTVTVGQRIEIQNHAIDTEATVRWVIEGKAGNMVFAGIELDAEVTWNAPGAGKVPVKVNASQEIATNDKVSPHPTGVVNS